MAPTDGSWARSRRIVRGHRLQPEIDGRAGTQPHCAYHDANWAEDEPDHGDACCDHPAPTSRSTVTVLRSAVIVPASPPTTVTGDPGARAGKPLEGKVIAVDPGHNGGNAAAPGIINQIIWNGRERETCDTTEVA